jgi:hypothetical protein
MKRVCLATFLVFCFCSVICSAADCDLATNPQLQYFKALGVEMLDHPSTDTDKCGNEWKDHGTCCEEKSLVGLLEKRNLRDEQDLKALVEEVKTISRIFSAIVGKGESLFASRQQSASFKAFQKVKADCHQLSE